MNTKGRSHRAKRGTSESPAPEGTPTPGATLVAESSAPPPDVGSRRELTTPMRPPSLSAPESSTRPPPVGPPTPSVPVIVEPAGLTPTPPPSQAGSKASRRPPRSRTSKTPTPPPASVSTKPPRVATPTPPPPESSSEAPPDVAAKGGAKKSSRKRPAAKKSSSIEPAPLTTASPAPRVGLESGGWRKPEPSKEDEPVVPAHGADVDERFFADGEHGPVSQRGKTTFSDLDEPEHDLRAMLKNAPGAQRRRERYARFVRWVVVAGVAVLTAGLVRVAIAKREYQPVQKVAAVAPVKVESRPSEVAASPQAAQLAAGTTQEAPPAVTAEQPPSQAEAPKAADEAPSAPPAGTPEESAEEAKKAKKVSQHALEVGKVKDSIEAGERAVALDPTDAESWLILGAAYQQAGKQADARRCFKSCLQLGTHGPKGECAAMPH
jgi:tetratricopeptide repeat protein